MRALRTGTARVAAEDVAMTFDPNARLDPAQVRDVRGRRMGGTGMALGAGGGGLALVLVLVYTLLGGDPGALSGLQGQVIGEGPVPSALADECQTGAQANERDDCRIVGYVNSVQAYWADAFAQASQRYEAADTVFFSGAVQTACGGASSAAGPFYCPADRLVYIDLGFFDELRARFGAQGGPFAQAYVIAHEYGHHVQNLLGVLGGSQGGSGPESQAVRIELQADCFAGVWAGNAEETGYLVPLTQAEINDALSAAAAVGDDRIQEATSGQVNPEAFTHGTSEQRQRWFMTGYQSADPNSCDTFGTEEL
jgi:predicted metalloprotease